MSNISHKIDQMSPLQRAAYALKETRSKLDAIEGAQREPIAIIGMGCRFPGGANNPELFWQLLQDGLDASTDIPGDRWNVDAYYDSNPEHSGKMYTKRGSFLDVGVDKFDAQFFGLTPREVASMDPQQRLLLEVSWEALEAAGQASEYLANTKTGVFMGVSTNDYSQLTLQDPNNIDVYAVTGNSPSVLAGRLSYFLGIHGPSLALDTACSSSLVAIHLAAQSLRNQECSLALAGGVNLILSPQGYVSLSKMRALSPDGRCKTFAAAADGYGRGEGCGVIVLKRLSDAVKDSDHILALLRSSAINHDGYSSGLTVPNAKAQQEVIRSALTNGKVQPSEINYVEAHGTGTSLGDPIEVNMLGTVLGKERSETNPLLIGSAKTNIGHLEAAAGVAGLIKVVLAMQQGEIPPHLHLEQINPHISLADNNLQIPRERTPWSSENGTSRLAGVSSFGVSGTNAHVILESAPSRQRVSSAVERPLDIFTLSAKSEAALKALATQFANHLKTHPLQTLKDICFTANTGRSHFAHRLVVVADDPLQISQQLTAFASGEQPEGLLKGQIEEGSQPKIAFLFTGQGSQYIGMGRQLYETQPTFRQALDHCDQLLRPYLEQSILSVLYPEPDATSPLDDTAYTQPALFAVEYSLAQLWRSWGIEPTIVVGHSVGEYVAACIAGVFSLSDGLKLIAARGRLMQTLPQDGEMVAVFANEARVAAAIKPFSSKLAIAGINGPQNIVISGEKSALQKVLPELVAEGIEYRPLKVSHAFHSPLMEPILATFADKAAQVTYATPKIGLISNLTGQLAEGKLIANADYWCRHLREPVRFLDTMETLYKQDYEMFVEIGPQPILSGMGKRCFPAEFGTWLPSLQSGFEDWQVLLNSLGTLYSKGQQINWKGFDQDYQRYRLSLPTYTFERQSYWTQVSQMRSTVADTKTISHPLLGQKLHSPLKQIQFESQFSIDSLPLVDDHRTNGTSLLNFAFFLEMAIASAEEAFDTSVKALESVVIPQAMFLPEQGAKTVQTILTVDDLGKVSFQIFSLSTEEADSADPWQLHAAGQIILGKADVNASHNKQLSLAAMQAQYPQEIPSAHFYQKMEQRGVELGNACRGLERLWKVDGKSLGKLRLFPPEEQIDQKYNLPLDLIDAGSQLLDASLPDILPQFYMIIGLESFQFYGYSGQHLWAEAILEPGDNYEAYQETILGDLILFDESGQLVAEMRQVKLKRVMSQGLVNKEITQTSAVKRHQKNNSISRETILTAIPEERQALLETYLIEELTNILQLPATSLKPQQSPASLLDSLMTFELKHLIETNLGIVLPIGKFFEVSSISQLASLLLEKMLFQSLVFSEVPSTATSEDMEDITL